MGHQNCCPNLIFTRMVFDWLVPAARSGCPDPFQLAFVAVSQASRIVTTLLHPMPRLSMFGRFYERPLLTDVRHLRTWNPTVMQTSCKFTTYLVNLVRRYSRNFHRTLQLADRDIAAAENLAFENALPAPGPVTIV